MSLKKFTKKSLLPITCAVLSALSLSANATCQPGMYIGGQLGWGKVHQDPFSDWTSEEKNFFNAKSSDTGLAGRVFAGYQFNQNLGLEMGYMKLHNSEASINLPNIVSLKQTIKTDAVDLMAKATLPLGNCFSVYAKAGAAYVRAQGSATSATIGGQTVTIESETAKKLLPAAAIGAGYQISQNLVADVSWTHIQNTSNDKRLGNVDFVGVGLTYGFG